MDTKYVLEVYFLIAAANKDAANDKFEMHGYGPDNFSQGLSTTGNPPAAVYHAHILMRYADLHGIEWIANNAPRSWIWIRVRKEKLTKGQIHFLKKVREALGDVGYQDLNWQTRSKACVRIDEGDEPIDYQRALEFIKNNAVPSVDLQLISE